MSQHQHYKAHNIAALPTADSLLDKMIDGREFESLLNYTYTNINIRDEIRKAIQELQGIRKHPVVCYVANTVSPNVKANISINQEDDLPFNELISTVDPAVKEVDVLLVTPGGSAQQVDKFVNALRPRFNKVNFIIPSSAMSAGSIFIMSGDEIIMTAKSCFGPIDPQVPDKNGQFVPAQSILELIEEIQKRGQDALSKRENPRWTDLQILNNMDAKEIGNAYTGSKYSVDLVTHYLRDYKFRNWLNHSNGSKVTDIDKEQAASRIANLLCDHGIWKTHGYGITREVAENVLKLKITRAENVDGLECAIRRMWALLYWVFESTPIYKIFISSNYCVVKHDITPVL